MEEVSEHLRRYPTQAGREALAARLGLTVDPHSQDWEWEVADPDHFPRLLALYRDASLSDEERFSLMEMLVQCVEDMCPDDWTRNKSNGCRRGTPSLPSSASGPGCTPARSRTGPFSE